MSILERMNKAIEEIDTATMEELVHDDFQFYFHSSGANIGKSEIIEWVKSGDVKMNHRQEFYLKMMRLDLIIQLSDLQMVKKKLLWPIINLKMVKLSLWKQEPLS